MAPGVAHRRRGSSFLWFLAVVRAVGGPCDGGAVQEVALRSTEPELTTAKARSWGIKQPIQTVTTDLGASPANRIHNVKLLASILDGQVVPPGEIFSFNEYVGQRTKARGFKEGYAIVGGLFVLDIGGGVCQAATTVYDAAFYAGLRIEERANHSFYISHYALGMDATVDWAGPDTPGDAPRIVDPRWELCGRDAYVCGPLAFPPR